MAKLERGDSLGTVGRASSARRNRANRVSHGLRLRFHVVEHERGRLFTDEASLPGARMGHRHLLERGETGGSVLTNTIYIEGRLAALWRRILGPAAARSLPDAQRAIVALTSRRAARDDA